MAVDAVSKITITAAYVVLGILLRQLHVVDRRDGEALLRVAVNVTLPALLFKVAIAARSFVSSGSMLPIWLGCVIFNAFASVASYLVFGRRVSKRADRALLSGIPLGANLGLFAYPLVEAVFGPEGLAIAALFDVPNSLAVFGLAQAVFVTGRKTPASEGGRREHADGGLYDGDWSDGKKHGHGVYSYPSGARYEGQWANDSRDGYGVYVFPSGGSYVGSFVNGMPQGLGVRTSPKGKATYGRFDQGNLSETLQRQAVNESIQNAASAAAAARRVAANAQQSALPLARAVVRKLVTFPPLLAVLGGNAIALTGVEQLPFWLDSVLSPLAQANRVAVMVALGTLLDVQVRAHHVRLAGDALALKYSVSLVSALFIALVLPSALAELKPILATLVCMPIPSVYVQYAIDNGLNSTAASLAVHTSNIISFALLLIMAAASGTITPWQQSNAGVAATTQMNDPWVSLSIASAASLCVLLTLAYALSQRIRLVQLRWEGGMPPPQASKRKQRDTPPTSGGGTAASATSSFALTSATSRSLHPCHGRRCSRACRLKTPVPMRIA